MLFTLPIPLLEIFGHQSVGQQRVWPDHTFKASPPFLMHGLGAAQQHFQIIRSVNGLINSHANMSSAKLTVFLYIILVISGNSYNFTLIFNGLKMGKVFKSKT